MRDLHNYQHNTNDPLGPSRGIFWGIMITMPIWMMVILVLAYIWK